MYYFSNYITFYYCAVVEKSKQNYIICSLKVKCCFEDKKCYPYVTIEFEFLWYCLYIKTAFVWCCESRNRRNVTPQ